MLVDRLTQFVNIDLQDVKVRPILVEESSILVRVAIVRILQLSCFSH